MTKEKRLHCNDCNLCCEIGLLVVNIYKVELVSEKLDIEQYTDNEWQVRKFKNGKCVHLGKDGCKVYDDRPFVCRDFDCRWYLKHTVQEWKDMNWSRRTCNAVAKLQKAARALNRREKQSIARRFNAILSSAEK